MVLADGAAAGVVMSVAGDASVAAAAGRSADGATGLIGFIDFMVRTGNGRIAWPPPQVRHCQSKMSMAGRRSGQKSCIIRLLPCARLVSTQTTGRVGDGSAAPRKTSSYDWLISGMDFVNWCV